MTSKRRPPFGKIVPMPQSGKFLADKKKRPDCREDMIPPKAVP